VFSVGIWIWTAPVTAPGWWVAYVDRIVASGLRHAVVKVADGVQEFNGDLGPAVGYARERGLHVWVWSYSPGRDPAREGEVLGRRAAALRADGAVVDAEEGWRIGGPSPDPLVGAVRRVFPRPVYLSSFSTRALHPEFPWDAWLPLVDGTMPQVYQRPQAQWLHRALGDFADKDVIPIGIADPGLGSPEDTREFLDACRVLGIASSLWCADHATPEMWDIITQITGAGAV
jgi:hypothetical protein